MPTIRKTTKVVHVLEGRRVKAGTRGAEAVRSLSAKWYGFGVPGLPADKGVPLSRDRAASLRQLAELVRRAERGLAGVPDTAQARTPLLALLPAFALDAAAGLASRARTKRRPEPKQVAVLVQRVRDCLAGCGFETAADLGPAAAGELSAYLAGRVGRRRLTNKRPGGDPHASGLSHQTADFHLAAVRRFAWWLAVRRKMPVDPALFADVAGFDPRANRVHARRAGNADELGRLLAAARASPRVRFRLTGDDRCHLYLTAMTTGYRCEELAALTPAHFHLAADPPLVVLAARDTKGGRVARQPVPPWAAAALAAYLAGRTADRPVWPGGWWACGAELLRLDLPAAGIAYRRDDGEGPAYFDFHAIRHSYVSLLADAGAGPKELQVLARHLDPRLTLGVYTHARSGKLADAVGRLPRVLDAGRDEGGGAGGVERQGEAGRDRERIGQPPRGFGRRRRG